MHVLVSWLYTKKLQPSLQLERELNLEYFNGGFYWEHQSTYAHSVSHSRTLSTVGVRTEVQPESSLHACCPTSHPESENKNWELQAKQKVKDITNYTLLVDKIHSCNLNWVGKNRDLK